MVGPPGRRARAVRPTGPGVSSWPPRPRRARRRLRRPRPPAPRRRPARAASAPSAIEVNGTRISRKTSIETRKPANRNSTPRNLPSWNSSVIPNRFSVSPSVGDEAADRDEDRRRDAAVELARDQRPDRARQRGDEVDGDRDERDQQVEQELVARLVRVERVGQHAPLGHEHVGREERAEERARTPPVMFMNGVSSRSCGREERRRSGRRSPGRARSPGAGSVVVAIRTSDRTVAPIDGRRREAAASGRSAK